MLIIIIIVRISLGQWLGELASVVFVAAVVFVVVTLTGGPAQRAPALELCAESRAGPNARRHASLPR